MEDIAGTHVDSDPFSHVSARREPPAPAPADCKASQGAGADASHESQRQLSRVRVQAGSVEAACRGCRYGLTTTQVGNLPPPKPH